MANDTHRGRSSGVATRRATHNDKTCDWGGYPESGPEQASRSIVPPAECGNKTPPQHTTKPAKERVQKVHRCARMMCRCVGMMYRRARRVYRYPTNNARKGL